MVGLGAATERTRQLRDVIKVLDEKQSAAIAWGQTASFGGLEGSLPATPPTVGKDRSLVHKTSRRPAVTVERR